ncbi:cytochrome P450 [Trametes versicolor FP-101664 SS1]|uniref:cytochrome P450 n=1 Tax=Trametes versicolor (strain FP-101664) TaxID=717944 RepID=UPI0004622A7F|nr:cytochrome P450 [Trametes versicolor FP-101664 SS1]EIW55304.1 cytochrome P450 [Trametes versicolor FP-101664 SS1]
MILYAALLCALVFLWRRSRIARSLLDKVPGPPRVSFLLGNAPQIAGRQCWDFHTHIARKYGSVVKLHWLFGTSALYIFDPLALSHIVKDQGKYEEPAWVTGTNLMTLGPGLGSVTGETHRRQRKMLTPVFSAKHLRTIVPIFHRVTDKARSATLLFLRRGTDIDILGWMSRAALELIGQAGIGYSFDPLTEDVPDAYAEAIKDFAPVMTSPGMLLIRQAGPYVGHLGPAWLRRWIIEKLPLRDMRRLIQVTDALHERSLDIFQAKKAAVEVGDDTDAKDIMGILLRENMKASGEDRLPEDQLIGQMSIIIFAAMDTTSNTMARILQLLATHPDVQTKLRREIIDAKAVGRPLDYDQLHNLPYLDAVCRETLRLHPSAPMFAREVLVDTILPLSHPIRATDGTLLHELALPRGANLLVSILSCNRNEALWGADAHEWKPERWLAPLPAAVENAAIPGVYSNLMTFMGSARSCIGFTFSQLEMKVVLSEIIANFTFSPSTDTPVIWNFAGVTYPTVSTESTKSELWLKMKAYREG